MHALVEDLSVVNTSNTLANCHETFSNDKAMSVLRYQVDKAAYVDYDSISSLSDRGAKVNEDSKTRNLIRACLGKRGDVNRRLLRDVFFRFSLQRPLKS